MNVSATGPPTVMWKCPTIHIVLWTSESMPYEALTSPPKPPKMNRIMPQRGSRRRPDRPTAAQRIVPDESASCPACVRAISNDAKIANAVMNDGIATP